MKISSKRFLRLLPIFTLAWICVFSVIETAICDILHPEWLRILPGDTTPQVLGIRFIGLILIGLYLYLYVGIVSKHITHFWYITPLFFILQHVPFLVFYVLFQKYMGTILAWYVITFVPFYILVYQHFKKRGEIETNPLPPKVTGRKISSNYFFWLLPIFITIWHEFVYRSSVAIEMIKLDYFTSFTIENYFVDAIPQYAYLYAYLCLVSLFVKHFWRVTILFLMPVVFYLIYGGISSISDPHDDFQINDLLFFIGSLIVSYAPFYILVYQHFKRRGEIGKLKGGKLKVDATLNGEVESGKWKVHIVTPS